MKLLRAASVRRKLLGISMISSATALLLASVILSVYDFVQTRRLLRQELAVLASVIGDRSTAALVFGDEGLAAENLAASQARRSIESACIYNGEDRLFATFVRRPGTGAPCPAAPPPDGSRYRGQALILVQPIVLDGERIGSIYLRSNLLDLEQRLVSYAGVAVLVVLLAAGVALFASARLQRIVSHPIRNLVRTAGTITEQQNYAARAVKVSDDELGVLVDAFNGMLDTLEDRDRELVEANRRLEEAIAELESKNVELERFTYTVSHDLRSPLITIRGFLGMLLKDAKAGSWEQVDHDMERIRSATETMARLLDELLELSRIGRLVGDSQEIPFGELVREALELVAGQLAERGVEVQAASDLPTVTGDRQRLLEVMQNLVENAIKFMGDQERPRIEIGYRAEDEAFCVRDNGIGIDPRYQDRVFGLFERLDTATEGTGIGLAIVQRVVELHGGRIWVESEGPGCGSAFCFTLSSGTDAPEDGKDETGSLQKPSRPAGKGRNRTR